MRLIIKSTGYEEFDIHCQHAIKIREISVINIYIIKPLITFIMHEIYKYEKKMHCQLQISQGLLL